MDTENIETTGKAEKKSISQYLNAHHWLKAAVILAVLMLIVWLYPARFVVYGLWGWGAVIALPLLFLGSIFGFASLGSVKNKAVRRVKAISVCIVFVVTPLCHLSTFFLIQAAFKSGSKLGLFAALFWPATLLFLLLPVMIWLERKAEKKVGIYE